MFAGMQPAREVSSNGMLSGSDDGSLSGSEDDFSGDEEKSTEWKSMCTTQEDDCLWCIDSSESVYNDGIFRIVDMTNVFHRHGMKMFVCQAFAVVLLLTFNAALQLQILSRVSFLVQMGIEDRQEAIMHNCQRRTGEGMPFAKNLAVQPFYWDCAPLAATLMTNMSFLDANQDGVWSQDDYPTDMSTYVAGEYRKNIRLTPLLNRLILRAKAGKFLSQKNLVSAEWYKQTNAWTAIPMTWLKKEEPVLHLCMNINPELCGNLENRGILKAKLGNVFPGLDTTQLRVEKCREVMDTCADIYGEIFRYYGQLQEQRCGAGSFNWDTKGQLLIVRYANAMAFDPMGNKWAITRQAYKVFLALVLIIWWLVVVGEVRSVMSWWMVVLWKDSKHPEGKEDVDVADDEITVNAIPLFPRLAIIILIMIPRTIICMGLSWQGSLFLLYADNYADLILNSTALAFLTEIDEMLFSALCSEKTKKKLAILQPISTRSKCCQSLGVINRIPISVPIICMVTAIVAGFCIKGFFERAGKFEMAEAYSCMCHSEGQKCVGAQVLGGLYHTPPALY